MKKIIIAVLIFVIFSALFFITPFSSGASNSEIEIYTDLQILDIGDVYGGHITWEISGEIAKELREAIGEEYHVSSIDIGTASKYFKGELEHVVEQNRFGCGYLAFVRIEHSDPLHGDTQGILNDPNDVAGLIGSINSTATITLKMLIRGSPVAGRHFVVSQNLSLAPFYALVNNASELSRFHLSGVKIIVHHSEVLAGLGSLRVPEGTFIARLIFGMYFMSEGGWVEYAQFDPVNSPLVLFVIYLGAAYGLGKMYRAMGNEKKGTLMEKKAKWYSNSMRLALLIIYILLPLSGAWYIFIVSVIVVVSYFIIKKIYG